MTTSISSEAGQPLKHPHAECDGCPLYEQPYVANYLPQGAAVAVIGEAPGYQEIKSGRPFVGPSGKLLNGAMKSAGIEGDVAQLNVVACRPPQNRTPSTNEVFRCSKRLQHDLDQTDVETIVTLGNTATKHFTGLDKITKARVGPPREIDGYKVIPTFHPASCLRVGDNYPSLLRDLQKVNEPPSTWEAPEEWLLLDHVGPRTPTTDLLASLVQKPSMPLVVDIEVGIEKDSHFGHPEQYQLLCVGLAWEGAVVAIGERALGEPFVRELLQRILYHHKVICHNGKFDLTLWPETELFFDTMLASYVRDERPGTNSLEYNATEILGSPSWKAQVEKYLGPNKNYADIPRDVLYRYNAYDIYNTWLLYLYFDRVLSSEERALHDILCRLSQVLMHAEMRGSNLDLEYLKDLDVSMLKELEELEAPTRQWVDNPRSPKQVKEAFHEMGYNIASTNETTLTDLRRRARPEACEFIDSLLKYRGKQKLHSTYVKGLIKREHEGRIHPSFLIHGTTTGRLSSRNPNIQNQPRGPIIRRAFIPDPGFVYVQADYATAELRVLGIEACDSYLIDVLTDPNRDIHAEVADQFYGSGQWDKDQRVRAKAVVFGVSYGREAESIAIEFGISMKEAQGAIDAFFALIPDVVAYQERLRHRVFHEGWDPVNHFGRMRRFHLITKGNYYDVEKQLKAFMPQSTANDICFRAAVRLWEKYRLDIRILVHDSILAQTRPDEADEIGRLMATEMQATAEEEYSDMIPFFVDYEVGPNWGALV